jgi:cytoskeletal protein CcmA (bactofilin family)
MKRLFFLLLTSFFLISTPLARAFTSEDFYVYNQRLVTLPANQTVDSDFFAAAEQVEVAGTITGDAYVAAGQIIISGTIDGDLLVLGGQVTITGTVGQNLRILAGQVTVNGTVSGNISVIAGTLDIASTAIIRGNVITGSGNVTLSSPIAGNVKLAAGNATVGNTVAGDLIGGVGRLHLTSSGQVDGNLVYWSQAADRLSLSEEATISGVIEHRPLPGQLERWQNQMDAQALSQGFQEMARVLRLIGLLGMILVGFLLIHFFPNYSYRSIQNIENRPLNSMLLGLAALILTPFVGVFLLFSVIGTPLAVLLFIAYGVYLYFAKIIFAYWLGARLLHRLRREAGKTVTFMVGAGIYYLLTSFAIVAPITLFVAAIFGLGAMLLNDKQTYLKARRSRLL